MNTVIGSIVSTLEDLGDPPKVPPDRTHEQTPSLEAARDIYRDAVALARGRMIAAAILAGGALLTVGRLQVW